MWARETNGIVQFSRFNICGCHVSHAYSTKRGKGCQNLETERLWLSPTGKVTFGHGSCQCFENPQGWMWGTKAVHSLFFLLILSASSLTGWTISKATAKGAILCGPNKSGSFSRHREKWRGVETESEGANRRHSSQPLCLSGGFPPGF